MKEGTFLVTETDEETAILRDASDGQVHTLAENPGLAAEEVVEATIEPEPPLEVAWSVAEIDRQYAIAVEHSEEPPTRQAIETAADQSVGEVTRRERAGTGEVHVLTVPEADTESTVEDVLADETTVERAARLGVERVEVRAAEGAVSVRYLP